jgi:hypothetical protein
MLPRYAAIWRAAYEEIPPGDEEMRPSLAHAIASAVEAGLSWTSPDAGPPAEPEES